MTLKDEQITAIEMLAASNSLSDTLTAARKLLETSGERSYHNAVLVQLAKKDLEIIAGKLRRRMCDAKITVRTNLEENTLVAKETS